MAKKAKVVKKTKPKAAAKAKAKPVAKKPKAKVIAKKAVAKPLKVKTAAVKKPKAVVAKPVVAKKLGKTVEKAPKQTAKPEKIGKTKAPVVGEVVVEVTTEVVEEVILTDAEGRKYCRARDCDQLSMVEGYCRYHYLLFWKRIQVRKKILTEGKLERYVEELTARYPDKFLEILKKDLRSEKDFLAAIQELEIDESLNEDGDMEDETQNYIEEVRGIEPTAATDSDEF